MNIIFHALLGLVLVKMLGFDSAPGILVGTLFAVFPDFDHVTHLKKALRTGRFGVEARSPLHELVGLAVVLSCSVAAIAISPSLFPLTPILGLNHFIVDFLTRPCRPLYPFSAKKLDLKLYPRELREMAIWDTVLTASLGLILLMAATA